MTPQELLTLREKTQAVIDAQNEQETAYFAAKPYLEGAGEAAREQGVVTHKLGQLSREENQNAVDMLPSE